MKPEYDQWADQLLQEIYYTPENLRVPLVKEHLLKAVQRGYLDGMENSWHSEREKCVHQNVISKLTNPPQYCCQDCGVPL